MCFRLFFYYGNAAGITVSACGMQVGFYSVFPHAGSLMSAVIIGARSVERAVCNGKAPGKAVLAFGIAVEFYAIFFP